MSAYIPNHGDLIALTFDPQAGREQKGKRPALVVSEMAFNRATHLAICCPITKTKRNIPFHVAIPEETGLSGFVMCEQIKSVDFRKREGKLICKAPINLTNEVLAILDAVLYPETPGSLS